MRGGQPSQNDEQFLLRCPTSDGETGPLEDRALRTALYAAQPLSEAHRRQLLDVLERAKRTWLAPR
jgi:hypothetical protein